jgi:hypothetical protein
MTDLASDPPGIIPVGLLAAGVLHVLGVTHHQLEGAFQGGINRQPVDASGLHPHRLATALLQPDPQVPEASQVGRELLLLDLHPPLGPGGHETDGKEGEVHIQATGLVVDDFIQVHRTSFRKGRTSKHGTVKR